MMLSQQQEFGRNFALSSSWPCSAPQSSAVLPPHLSAELGFNAALSALWMRSSTQTQPHLCFSSPVTFLKECGRAKSCLALVCWCRSSSVWEADAHPGSQQRAAALGPSLASACPQLCDLDPPQPCFGGCLCLPAVWRGSGKWEPGESISVTFSMPGTRWVHVLCASGL